MENLICLRGLIMNIKNIISYILDFLGVLFWIFGLCAITPEDNMAFCFINLAFLVAGCLFIVISLKINPEHYSRLLDEEIEETKSNTLAMPPVTCYVMDGDMPIRISEPLSDWDRCYLIAWQEKTAEQR